MDEATKIVVSAETTNSGTTKGNGSGQECDAQNTINHPDELGHVCQKLDQIIGEVDKMGQEVDQVTGDTLLLSAEEGREMMNQKLDKAEEELNSLGQELGDIIEEDDDDDEDSLHSALGFPDRSKSGSVKSLIDEFELRSMTTGTSPSWAEMMDREEEEKMAKTSMRTLPSQRGKFRGRETPSWQRCPAPKMLAQALELVLTSSKR